jgi:hypothetical protein
VSGYIHGGTEPPGTCACCSHPFLDGLRQITVAGFSGRPVVKRNADIVGVEVDGLSASFVGALVEWTDDALIVTVPAADTGE